jgi:RNA-directed DNA polymerase
VSQALGRIRQAAKQRKKEKFTTLFHHIGVELLRLAFFALKKDALFPQELQRMAQT